MTITAAGLAEELGIDKRLIFDWVRAELLTPHEARGKNARYTFNNQEATVAQLASLLQPMGLIYANALTYARGMVNAKPKPEDRTTGTIYIWRARITDYTILLAETPNPCYPLTRARPIF